MTVLVAPGSNWTHAYCARHSQKVAIQDFGATRTILPRVGESSMMALF